MSKPTEPKVTDGIRSGVYRPNPDKCCEKCVFNHGEHAVWCKLNRAEPHTILDPDDPENADYFMRYFRSRGSR